MAEEQIAGVLLMGSDGSHYFIPHSELSRYTISEPAESAEIASAAPRLDAFTVQQQHGDAEAAHTYLITDRA